MLLWSVTQLVDSVYNPSVRFVAIKAKFNLILKKNKKRNRVWESLVLGEGSFPDLFCFNATRGFCFSS